MIRGFIKGLGELFLTFGVVVVLFACYTLWGTGQYTADAQESLHEQLDREWAKPQKVTTEKIKLGDGVALIRIPKFGKKYRFVIVEGVGVPDLRKGPGHYPDTALPGQTGNFVVSGHRTTYSAPFNRIGELDRGDKILIDTRDMQYVYKVTDAKIVTPDRVDVAEPVPFHPGKKPKDRLITLTTCHPKYSAAQRLIVFGELDSQTPRVTEEQRKSA